MRTKIIVGTVVAVVVVGIGLLGYASTRPPSFHTFRTTAVQAASGARDALRTARLTLDAQTGSKTIPPYVSVVLDECRSAVATSIASFVRLQPIDAATTAMRDQLVPLLSRAATGLGDVSADAARAAELDPIADKLDEFLDQHA